MMRQPMARKSGLTGLRRQVPGKTFRVFSCSGEIQSGVKFSYPIDIIESGLLSPFAFGIRFQQCVINSKADELQLLRVRAGCCLATVQSK